MIVRRYIDIESKEDLKRLRYVELSDEDKEKLKRDDVIVVVIYARYSSDMQREESIDAQIRYCKEEIRRNPNMVLVAVYYDEAETGKFDTREDFQNMISHARSLRFNQIMVHKFSRFARNQYDSVIYKRKLREIGIRVVSATQKIDDTPEGQMTESIIEVLDEYYSANLAEEVLKGMRENALKGKSTGGRPPIGYNYDAEGYLEINEETAPIVRKIYDMYLAGCGMVLIANTLNSQGYRSQTGNVFHGRTISDILTNEKYTGTSVYTIKNEEIKVMNAHPAIIDRAEWDRVQEMRAQRTKPRIVSNVLYALTGKLYCGKCGGMFSGGGSKTQRNGKRKNYYYVCNNKRHHGCKAKSLNKDKIERYLCQKIVRELLNDESIEQITNTFEEMVQEMVREKQNIPIEQLEKEKTALNKKISKLLDLYLDDENEMSKEMLNEKTNEYKKQVKAIEKQIRAAKIDLDSLMKKEEAAEYLRQFRKSYDESNKVMVRALIDTFVDKLIIHDDKVDVTFKVDISRKDGGDDGGSSPGKPAPNKEREVLIVEGGIVSHGRGHLKLPPQLFKLSVTRKDIDRIDISDLNII